MAPGVLPHDFSFSSDTVLRASFDQAGELDRKAVGGHLPLRRMPSTPVGVPAMTGEQFLEDDCTTMLSLRFKQHRKLDRTVSEPVQSLQVQPQQPLNSSRYKTELCRTFEESGTCKYGDKCQFAHGSVEMRNVNRHPKYKTELCRTFHTNGICPYGTRCNFVHREEDVKAAGHAPVSGKHSLGAMAPHNQQYAFNRNSALHQGSGMDLRYLLALAGGPMSPPPSAQNSPTNRYFDDHFALFPVESQQRHMSRSLLDMLAVNLSGGYQGLTGPQSPGSVKSLDLNFTDSTLLALSVLADGGLLDSPPDSPIDLDSLSLSSGSPTPSGDIASGERLPIFQKLSG